MQSETENYMYALRDVSGKGKGLIATKKIFKGTRILSEKPIILLPRYEPDSEKLWISIREQVNALSEHQRQAFLSMHNIHTFENAAEQYLGIARTNALPIETNIGGAGIFLDACRINHACDNNAQKDWNENIKRHTVHALRDIEKGEEITIYYMASHSNRKARHESLQAKFGFACSCHLCSLPLEQSRENDRILDEINRLDDLIGRHGFAGIVTSPLQILRYVDQQFHLYNELGPDDVGLSRVFFDAAQIAIAHGDLARGRIFMERAVSVSQTACGGDSPQVIQYRMMMRDLSKHDLYGISTKWRMAVDEAPRELEPNDFEDWLWRRGKPKRPGQLADLRNFATFPGFAGLPDENDVDLDFYQSVGVSTYRPRRHWCFLGEIIDLGMLLRMQMDIKDVDGRTIPLFFYTDGRGREMAPTQLQRGYTVAILYAIRHAFMFDNPGIRHEDPQTIKIFPLPLHELLALNDRVQQFSMGSDGTRMCHGCGKKATSLSRCGKCSLFWYCDKACQEAGWKEKGHRADCKLLKDPDLQRMFMLNWDKFDGFIRFPLQSSERE